MVVLVCAVSSLVFACKCKEEKLEKSEVKFRYGTIYEDTHINSWQTVAQTFIFMTRRILYVLVLMSKNFILKYAGLIFLSLALMSYYLHY